MKNKETRTLNYNFIAVPTNLFFALDPNLRSSLVVLLHLSSLFADSNGYFSISNTELQNYFRLGKNLTSVVLETLYRNNLISTKIEQTRTKKNIIKYRVNVERFADWDNLNFKSIADNDKYQIDTLPYGKDSNFKCTYTATTPSENATTSGNTPRIVQNQISEETPSPKAENVSKRQETSNPDNQEVITESERNEIGEMWLELQKANAPKIEYRTIKRPSNNLDESIKEKCRKLVARYVEMTIPSSNESLEKCNKAIDYINTKYDKGFIDIEDKDKFTKELIQARFKKHRI